MRAQNEELVPTRATLLSRLRNWQDESSWQDFFDTYWRLIYEIALKRGLTQAEAQDVVQETMIAVARHIPNFKYDPAIGSFKGWLLNLTRWKITDQLRKRSPIAENRVVQNRPPLESEADVDDEPPTTLEASATDLEAIWEQEWERNLLSNAIHQIKRRIDPRMYQIFDFYVNKEWSPEKIAEAFNVSVSLVYVTKHRITELIKAEVARLQQDLT